MELSAIGAGVNAYFNSSIKIFEITYQLKAVDEQTADLLSTTNHVSSNVNEARRLRRLKDHLLSIGERHWMDGIIQQTEDALRGVAVLIEPARVDKTTNKNINFGNRIMWVFRDSPKVRDKHLKLSTCHQSLTAVITCLHAKQMTIFAPVSEEKKGERPPPYDPQLEDLFNWQSQRRRRKTLLSLNSDGAAGRRGRTSFSSTNTTSTSFLSPGIPSLPDYNEEASSTGHPSPMANPICATDGVQEMEAPLSTSYIYASSPDYNTNLSEYNEHVFNIGSALQQAGPTDPRTDVITPDDSPKPWYSLPKIENFDPITLDGHWPPENAINGLQVAHGFEKDNAVHSI